MTQRGCVAAGLVAVVAMGCGGVSSTADGGGVKGAAVVINELAGSGGDFVELYNPGDTAFELSGFGLTDAEADGGIRYSTSLRFPTGAQVAAKGYFTIFLETDCPATVTPCVALVRVRYWFVQLLKRTFLPHVRPAEGEGCVVSSAQELYRGQHEIFVSAGRGV